MSDVDITFQCGRHRAFAYEMGGKIPIAELPLLNMVRWQRIRDDISTAEVVVPTSECCEILADLRTVINELHIYRNDVPVWQGPITRLEYEWDQCRIFAEDMLWVPKRCVHEMGYSHAYPNIGNAIERMTELMHHCFEKGGDPWQMLDHLHPIYGHVDPRTSRTVFAYQMYVWDDFDKYAEDYGADYVMVNRDLYWWDLQLQWMVLPPLDESHLSDLPRIVEYGNEAATRGFVTNGHGYAGITDPTAEQLAYYRGAIIDRLTTNEIDGQPGTVEGLEGDQEVPEEAPSIPTPEEIALWTDTAYRSISERFPAPVSIVIPANTTLSPGAPWTIDQLVPGAWFEVSTTRLCRSVTEWQRLHEIIVTEEAPDGERVNFTAISAPKEIVAPQVIVRPPWLPLPIVPSPIPPRPPPPVCKTALKEPFGDYSRWTISGGGSTIWPAGRNGSAARIGTALSWAQFNIPSEIRSAYLTLGFAWNIGALPAGAVYVADFYDDGVALPMLRLLASAAGQLTLQIPGSPTATSPTGLFGAQQWYFIEIKVRIHDTLGTYTVRLNESTVIAGSGIHVGSTGGEEFTAVRIGSQVSGIYALYDDFWLQMGPGCQFKGDQAIVLLEP